MWFFSIFHHEYFGSFDIENPLITKSQRNHSPNLIKVKLIHPKEEFIDTLIAAEKGKKEAKGIHFVDPMHNNIFIVDRLKIFPNQINYVHHNLLGGETLNLYRYYKSDWNGIYTGLFGSQTQILSFDCRTISNQIDQIINRYRTYPGMPDSFLD